MKRSRLTEYVFIFIGVFTPVGILAVNGSAYVMQHLDPFRVVLAISALVSSLFLQGLAAWALLGHLSRRYPALYAEYRRWAVAASVLVVVVWSAFGAWGTYWSMQDPRKLPNLPAVLVSLGLLALPIVTVVFGRQLEARRSARAQRAESEAARRARGVRSRSSR